MKHKKYITNHSKFCVKRQYYFTRKHSIIRKSSQFDDKSKKGDDYYLTNLNLLKSKMAAIGYTDFTTDLTKLLGVSWTAASQKLNGKTDFKQSEISILTLKLGLTGEDVKQIFTGIEQ